MVDPQFVYTGTYCESKSPNNAMSVLSKGDMAKIIKHVANNQFWDTKKVSYMGSLISRWTQKTQLEDAVTFSKFIIHTSDTKNLQQFKSESLLSLSCALP